MNKYVPCTAPEFLLSTSIHLRFSNWQYDLGKIFEEMVREEESNSKHALSCVFMCDPTGIIQKW